MHYFITIQYPYEYLSVTLSSNVSIIESITITKFQAVSKLIPAIAQLLKNHKLTLDQISCIGINTGPGPFNTLRTIIATANALSFAKKIPLVGCNGLQLMLDSNKLNHRQIVILDAFGNDVYYAISQTNQMGYASINELATMINALAQQTHYFIGNAITKHRSTLENQIKGDVYYDTENLFSSEESLYLATQDKYHAGLTEQELYPLYFQSPVTK